MQTDLKGKLESLLTDYNRYSALPNFEKSKEQTTRSYIEKLLEIFGWNCLNPLEVDQELTIESEFRHKRPDYIFKRGNKTLAYLDTKTFSDKIKNDKKSAFQIRAYGWSTSLPCSFLTNFKEFAIYDTRYKPIEDDAPDTARVFYMTIDEIFSNLEDLTPYLHKHEMQNGSLSIRFPTEQDDLPEGTKSLDEDFADMLLSEKEKMANSLLASSNDISRISKYCQKLIDIILFLRVCEGRLLEKNAALLNLTKKEMFLQNFSEYLNDAKQRYGGYLFEDIDKLMRLNWQEQPIINLIQKFYFPYPYAFEVIPPSIFGKMYERYLGNHLVLSEDGSKILNDYKDVYKKTKGAVYTPKYIVDIICEVTMKKTIDSILSVRELLDLKILDPACGSGSFLLGAFDVIEEKMIDLIKTTDEEKELLCETGNGDLFLTLKSKIMLINSCLFGVDIDAEARSIARLSLYLCSIFHVGKEPNFLFDETTCQILKSLGDNIKLGNSLVSSDVRKIVQDVANNLEEYTKLRPFDWWSKDYFASVQSLRNGFDIIVGNPPYIDVKNYKDDLPNMHKYLTSENCPLETCREKSGKVDLAIPFLERSFNLLNSKGRLGFIIQNRFFKTDYGTAIRKLLIDRTAIEKIFDFGQLKVFPCRSTYTAIMLLTKENKEYFSYKKQKELNKIQISIFNENETTNFQYKDMNSDPWSFDYPDLLELKKSLLEKFGKFEDFDELHIRVGIQVLYNHVYHIRASKIEDGIIYGKNRDSEEVKIERGACVPIMENSGFIPLKEPKTDLYAIFPYKETDGQYMPIPFTDFKRMYKLAGAYLEDKKAYIQSKVETNDGELWHTYTRANNLNYVKNKKILIPSTIQNVIACIDLCGEFCQDNVRVNSIQLDDNNEKYLLAIAAIMNSQLFDILSLSVRGNLQKDYSQFNKQFIKQMPIPWNKIKTSVKINDIVKIASTITKHWKYLESLDETEEILLIKNAIEDIWLEIDDAIMDLYELDSSQKQTVLHYCKKRNRTA